MKLVEAVVPPDQLIKSPRIGSRPGGSANANMGPGNGSSARRARLFQNGMMTFPAANAIYGANYDTIPAASATLQVSMRAAGAVRRRLVSESRLVCKNPALAEAAAMIRCLCLMGESTRGRAAQSVPPNNFKRVGIIRGGFHGESIGYVTAGRWMCAHRPRPGGRRQGDGSFAQN